jgi:hypothetical protein
MNQSVPLLAQGAMILLLGMGTVFAALALLWAFLYLLTRLTSPAGKQGPLPAASHGDPHMPIDLPSTIEPSIDFSSLRQVATPVMGATGLTTESESATSVAVADGLPASPSVERMRVALAVAALIQCSALLPEALQPPPLTAWVQANRARTLQPWSPTRKPEN